MTIRVHGMILCFLLMCHGPLLQARTGQVDWHPDLLNRALLQLDKRLQHFPDDHEASLLKGLLYFKLGDINTAYRELDRLTRRAPKFHLAHLIRGDLLLAKVEAVTDIGQSPLAKTLSARRGERLLGLREEALVRLRTYLENIDKPLLPREILLLAKNIPAVLIVDKTANRIYVYRNNGPGSPPVLEKDFYVSTGKLNGNKRLRGDLKTPEGVYFVTRHIPENKLPAKYGIGAFPVNYPNAYDRHLGKTGDGIWLHGTDYAYYSRPPRDSEGCVVLTNMELSVMDEYVRPGVTPVIITESIRWMEREHWLAEREAVLAAIRRWERDWESNDVERYLAHYDASFWSQGHDLKSWSSRKRRINRSKQFQQVELDNISLFHFPASAGLGEDLVLADFRQFYRSNNYNSDMRKRLYLKRNAGGWKILYEGSER